MNKNIKLLYLSFSILFVCTGCNSSAIKVTAITSAPKTAFRFVYSEYFHETSKDTHCYRTAYSLRNGKLAYDYVYNGFPAPDKKHKERIVNDAAIEKIRIKLKELNLYINHAKNYPINKNGMVVNTGKTLFLTDGEKSYKITITGGRPVDIKDTVSDRLAGFRIFIEKYFQN